jgi:hypothetical protein
MPLFDTSTVFYSGTQGTSNNTTPVTVVPDPGAGSNVFIVDSENLAVLNRDTVASTVTITLTNPTTIIERVIMQPGDKWTNSGRVAVGPGQSLTLTLGANVTTNQLTYTAVFFKTSD